MQIFIPLLVIGAYCSIFSGLFLYFYYRLVRAANKTTGKIISFDRSNYIILREILVPIVRFKKHDSSWIESQPEYSFFHELNNFVHDADVTVYYQEDKPEKFIIESKIEVFVNWMIIALTFWGIVWVLFMQFV